MQCCLGFFCAQSGINKLADTADPSDLTDYYKVETLLARIPELVYPPLFDTLYNTPLANDAIEINDDSRLSNEEREEALTALFKENGIDVEFTGEYTNKKPCRNDDY